MCARSYRTSSSRGVYTIESLEQMLQKNFRGGEDLTSNQGGMFQIHEILSVDS